MVLVLYKFDADAIYVWFFSGVFAISTQIITHPPLFIVPLIRYEGRPLTVTHDLSIIT